MNDEYMVPDEVLGPVLKQIDINPEGAVARLDELIGLYGEDARLQFLCGSVLAGLGRFADAHTMMQKAVAIAPGYDLARFQLGFLELTSGDANTAQETWAPLLNLPSDNPLKLFVEGLGKMLADEFEEAISFLQEGISRNQLLPPMNRDMGLLIYEMTRKLNAQSGETQIDSDANFLLKQFSFKNTKH